MIKVQTFLDTISAKDMEMGQIGIIISNTTSSEKFNGCIVIKTYNNRLVSLNSIDTWNNASNTPFQIKILPNGTMLEVTDNEGILK